MSRIFWDTNIFIYLFEGSGKFSTQVVALRNKMLARNDQLLTSAITLGEILVKPMQNHDAKAVAYYQKLIATTAVVIPFEEKAALAYARLRADRSAAVPRTRFNWRVRLRPEWICSSPTMRGCIRSRFRDSVHRTARSGADLGSGLRRAIEEKRRAEQPLLTAFSFHWRMPQAP